MANDTFEVLQQPRIQSRISDIKATQDEATRLILIKKLFNEIQKASKSIVDEIGAGVAITNLDEVTAALHNETTRNGKLMLAALKDLKLSGENQSKIMAEVMKDAQTRLEDEFQTIRIKRPMDKVHILNPEDFPVAEEVDITNWPDLGAMFSSLEKTMREALNITIPAPQVNVEAPQVNVEAPTLNIPEFELEPLIREVRTGLQKIRTNNLSNPVFVRLADIEIILDKLEEVRKGSMTALSGFPNQMFLKGTDSGIINPATSAGQEIAATMGDNSKTVITSGTSVQLLSTPTPCKWVIVVGKVTNIGTIYLGGSTVAVGRGRPLVALQSERIVINDVSKIWIDADTSGEGVTFCFGS